MGFYANVVIIWVVFVCNLIKLGVMANIIWPPILVAPIMTVGDAISSFIVNPDPATEKLGPMNNHLMKQLDKANNLRASATAPLQRTPIPSLDGFWTTSSSQQWWPK